MKRATKPGGLLLRAALDARTVSIATILLDISIKSQCYGAEVLSDYIINSISISPSVVAIIMAKVPLLLIKIHRVAVSIM
jgi:hypothetical protein